MSPPICMKRLAQFFEGKNNNMDIPTTEFCKSVFSVNANGIL